MGRYDLNLTEEEFWKLTLKELNALVRKYNDATDWLNYRAALICSVLANIWRGKNVKAFKPEDFMPGRKQGRQTPEQMFATVQLLNATFGGSVKEG